MFQKKQSTEEKEFMEKINQLIDIAEKSFYTKNILLGSRDGKKFKAKIICEYESLRDSFNRYRRFRKITDIMMESIMMYKPISDVSVPILLYRLENEVCTKYIPPILLDEKIQEIEYCFYVSMRKKGERNEKTVKSLSND